MSKHSARAIRAELIQRRAQMRTTWKRYPDILEADAIARAEALFLAELADCDAAIARESYTEYCLNHGMAA